MHASACICMLFWELMRPSDQVREYAKRHYIDPARRRRETRVRIVAGDVHRALRLVNRVPAVCSALSSKAFLEANRLRLESREGPPSGLSTTVTFTYGFAGGPEKGDESLKSFDSFRGVAKDVFAALGGGEAFIRAERAAWETPKTRKRL